MLEKGGSTVKIVPEIQRVKFSKNFWNILYSSITTLVGYTIPALYRPPPKDGENYEPYVSETTRSYVEEYTLPNIRAVLEEVLAVGIPSYFFLSIGSKLNHPRVLARAIGFPDSEEGIPSSTVDSTLNNTAALHVKASSAHRPSMLLDAENGKPIEVEVIVGEVVRMAKAKGVPVPVSITGYPRDRELITPLI